jgi:hypothetical protein
LVLLLDFVERFYEKMIVHDTVKQNDQVLRSIETELDDFEERYDSGSLISEDEWDLMSYDWHNLFYIYISVRIRKIEELTNEQKENLIALILRARSLKEKIIEKGYAYPEIIDQIAS